MKYFNPFEGEGKWFKGNLHCHSTNSDGRLSPAEVAEKYKQNDWDFLAFTEHNKFTDSNELGNRDFLIVPGIELGIENSPKFSPEYHVVGIKDPMTDPNSHYKHGDYVESPDWDGDKAPQEVIDRLMAAGNITIFCHPNWSRLELADFIDLTGFIGMEIYNHGCEFEGHTSLCIDYWDSFLRRGRKIWGFATDDAHHRRNDRCGGWIVAKMPELTTKALVEALKEGKFYSSTGPEIFELYYRDGEVFVESSPVKKIHFVTYERVGTSCIDEGGLPVSKASYKLFGDEKYVRIECVDFNGNTAWSNPIFLDALK